MNYIIEGDIDFWNELNNDNEESEKEKVCLLTNEKLSKITLPCNKNLITQHYVTR